MEAPQTWRLVNYEVIWWQDRKRHAASFGTDIDAARKLLRELRSTSDVTRYAELFRTEALNT